MSHCKPYFFFTLKSRVILSIISFCAMVVFLSSCSKPGDELSKQGYISFNVNGINQDWSESTEFSMYIVTISSGNYLLTARHRYSAKGMNLTLLAPSFTINTPYTYTVSALPDPMSIPHLLSISDFDLYDPNNLFTSELIGDFATITITSLKNNKANGTFTALLTRRSDSAKINITNGKFAGLDFQP